MYFQYFGLNEAPFSIAVNPRYLFMSARHRDALAHLLYGVGAGGGFILLTGEVGTGKTTINRCLLEQLPEDTDLAIILNPALNAMELLATACDELGIEYDREGHTLKSLTDALHAYLLENHSKGRKTVLMIDEAQHLDFEVLEQIRLLTNLETNSEKLLQIILIGQPELAQLLARPELRQLNQRITARYNLEPLNLAETGAYIQHRLQVAGMTADRQIFPPAVVKGIYRQTRGIPRLINVLCDRIMLGAYGRNKGRADMAMLRLATREVMGEEMTSTSAGRWWPWAGAAALMAMLFAGGWWYYGELAQTPARAQSPTANQTIPMAASVATAPAPVEEPMAEPEPEPEPEATPEINWLLAPEEAEGLLWSMHSRQAYLGSLCESRQEPGLRCGDGVVSTWDELTIYDRPILINLVTPERFAAAALLLGVQGREAWVVDANGSVQSLALAEMAPMWDGNYRFLWRAPATFEQPLAEGDEGPAVVDVAALFARLDGQTRPLTTRRFNRALTQRVIYFQEARGLEADGVVGEQTLQQLNAALGIDPVASALRQQLADGSAAQ
ncbi:general secretion pathway protein GspA [Halioglobus japonicus]|uniref:General secretion pathway protein GspA n=2 Tax=Halioglobus japonicus TaxID=930805 RepID=A0AAP8SPE2_9GAMM|nr:ExeA family protein [Halioglobus japonicus]AQA19518.1 general secretion pathway protein GspA [Halioglobus japonicus]PLW87419.1 general secretion pathway protein GspA [Halioglobus japonicus]